MVPQISNDKGVVPLGSQNPLTGCTQCLFLLEAANCPLPPICCEALSEILNPGNDFY